MASRLVKLFQFIHFPLNNPSSRYRKSKTVIKVTVGTLTVLCILGLTLGLVLYGFVNEPEMPFGPPSSSRLGKYQTAAVSSDGVPCSDIGRYAPDKNQIFIFINQSLGRAINTITITQSEKIKKILVMSDPRV